METLKLIGTMQRFRKHLCLAMSERIERNVFPMNVTQNMKYRYAKKYEVCRERGIVEKSVEKEREERR